MQLGPQILKAVLEAVSRTAATEIDCDTCFDSLGQFAEMRLAGLDSAEALPLVEQHLDMCPDCREEFEALSKALRALSERAAWFRFGRR